MPPRAAKRRRAFERCALALRVANAMSAADLAEAAGAEGGVEGHAVRWLGEAERVAAARWALELMHESIRSLHEATWGWDDTAKLAEIRHADSRLLVAEATSGADATPECEGEASRTGPPYAGFVLVRFVEEERNDEPTPVCYVYEAHVAADARGCGVGEALMRAAERAAAGAGMRACMLTVFRDNPRAARFYMSRLGYAVDASSPEHFPEMRIAPRADGRNTGEHAYQILSKDLEPTLEQALGVAAMAKALSSVPERASTRARRARAR